MKSKLSVIFLLLAGFFGGILFAGFVLSYSSGKMLVKEMKSPYTYEKTIETIVNRVNAKEGWHVVTVYDMNKEVVENGGKPIGKLSIIKYCNGKFASEMLGSDDRKMMGAMMPKAFAVYEKSDGQVYVSTANGAVMGKLYGGDIEKIIEKVSLEVEEILVFMNFKFNVF